MASPNLRETVFGHCFDSPDLHYVLNEVHVWLADLSAWQDPDLSCLDEAERSRRARFRFDADRERYEKSHAFLRALLGFYRESDPASLVMETGEFGKPRVAGGPHFNLSHAGARCAVAISWAWEVGVDVEWMHRKTDPEAILDRFFHPDDVSAWRNTPEQERHRLFFDAWTRQEAVLKASGTGIAGAIGRFPVLMPPPDCPWRVYPIDAGPDYAAAVAVIV